MFDLKSANNALNKAPWISNKKHDWFKVFGKGFKVAFLGAVSALTLALKDPLAADPTQYVAYTAILGFLTMLLNHIGHRK